MNFLEPRLPGIFEGHINPAINGALWTLKIEVGYYLVAPLYVALERMCGAVRALIAAVAFCLLYRLGVEWAVEATAISSRLGNLLEKQLPGQLIFFAMGSGLRLIAERVKQLATPNKVALLIGGALLVNAGRFVPLEELALLIRALGLAAMVAGFLWVPIRQPSILGSVDLSYGMYIFHYPLIQILISAGLFAVSPAAGMVTALLFAAIAAALSWNLLERHAIHFARARKF